MRLIHFAAPFIFSPAHGGTDYVSTHRLLKFERMAREVCMIVFVCDCVCVTVCVCACVCIVCCYCSAAVDMSLLLFLATSFVVRR